MVESVQQFTWAVEMCVERLELLHVQLVHEPAVVAPLAELLDVVVVALLGDF